MFGAFGRIDVYNRINICFVMLCVIVLLCGCNARKNFKPDLVRGVASFNGVLNSPIAMTNRVSAKLKNNYIITNDRGLEKVSLKDNENLVYEDSTYALVSSGCKELHVFTIKQDGNSIVLDRDNARSIELQSCLVSASIKGDLVAGISGDNSIFLYDLKEEKYTFKENGELIYAIYSNVANPVFLDTAVIYPTLDGRLNTIDIKTHKSLKNIIVNTDKFLNNIIYLKVIKDELVSATQKRVYTLIAGQSYNKDIEIRDLCFDGKYIYVLALDGTIYQLDKTLAVVHSVKLPFAILNGILIKDNYLYTFDSSAKFLIKLSLDNFSYDVFKLAFGSNRSSKNAMVFYTDNVLYINKRFLDLSKHYDIKFKEKKAKRKKK